MTIGSAVVSFALVAGLLTIIPGLDTAMVLRSAMANGRRHGFLTALGIGTGSLIWGVAAAVGISALLTASTMAYTTLRVVGAGYMIWMGARLLWTGVIHRPMELPPTQTLPVQNWTTARARRSWGQGVLTNLLNPKIGAFYLSVLPQFIPAHVSPLLMGVVLALVHDVEGLIWFTLIILGTQRIGVWLRRRSARKAMDGVTGSVLIGLGLKLGLSGR